VSRRVLVAIGAALLWLLVPGSLPAAQPPGADWSRPSSVQAGGIKVYYPRAWTAAVEGTIEQQLRAFNAAFRALDARLRLFVSLPLESLDRLALQRQLDSIGSVVSDESFAGGQTLRHK